MGQDVQPWRMQAVFMDTKSRVGIVWERCLE